MLGCGGGQEIKFSFTTGFGGGMNSISLSLNIANACCAAGTAGQSRGGMRRCRGERKGTLSNV